MRSENPVCESPSLWSFPNIAFVCLFPLFVFVSFVCVFEKTGWCNRLPRRRTARRRHPLPTIRFWVRPGSECRCCPCPGYATGQSALGSSDAWTRTGLSQDRQCPGQQGACLEWPHRDVMEHRASLLEVSFLALFASRRGSCCPPTRPIRHEEVGHAIKNTRKESTKFTTFWFRSHIKYDPDETTTAF